MPRSQSICLFASIVLMTAVVFFLAASPVGADQAADEFKQRYGDEYSSAINSRTSFADDVVLAKKLMSDLPLFMGNPELAQLICTRAYELGLSCPEGYPIAIAAIRKIGNIVPEKRVDSLIKECDIYEKQLRRLTGKDWVNVASAQVETMLAAALICEEKRDYDVGIRCAQRAAATSFTLGDSYRYIESLAMARHLNARKNIKLQTDRFAAKLKSEPENVANRNTLICQLVVDVDDPVTAAMYVNDNVDIVWRRYVPALAILASGSTTQPVSVGVLDLARWCASLTNGASDIGKLNMLRRAQTLYGEYLKTAKPASEEARTAQKELAEVMTLLEQATSAVLGGGIESPKIMVVSAKTFESDYGANFPSDKNCVINAPATIKQQYGMGTAKNVLLGKRDEDSWLLAAQEGTIAVLWRPAIQGRFVVIFANSGSVSFPGIWYKGSVSINGNKAIPVTGMSGGKAIIMDLGKPQLINTVTLRIDARDATGSSESNRPGISGIEIYPARAVK